MIKNWHPITLLCTDFKIIDKVITLRLQATLCKLIHKSQIGFQKGKRIGENILKLLTLIQHCKENEEQVVIMSIDFRKAFDTITWKVIDQVLSFYGFGPKIRSMVQTINNEIYCTFMNNGKWNDWFQIHKGCHQGSPSSAILYVLTAEILGMKIRGNLDIQGVVINGEKIKACQFADDM